MHKKDFECKKSFRHGSSAGITFRWLKCAFDDGLENAVKDAIRIVYFPSAIAFFTNGTERSKVIESLEQSRRTFDRWMHFAQETKPFTKQSPERVLIEFALSVDDSDSGVVLDWLLNHQDNVEKKILDAVLLVYLPVALSALDKQDYRMSIMRSLTIFWGWLDLAGYSSPVDDFTLTKPSVHQASHQDVAAEFQSLKNTLAVKDVSLEDIAHSGGVTQTNEPEASDPPDDMPEIDYDFEF